MTDLSDEDVWSTIESYFEEQHLRRAVRHQIESYDYFTNHQIKETINMFNPVTIHSEQDYDPHHDKYLLEIIISFGNFHIYRPQIHENNGATKLMFPQEARNRNFTYSTRMTVDMDIKIVRNFGEELKQQRTFYKTLKKIHIGKLPIMLKSNICVLSQFNHLNNDLTGECKYDAGGYFIINGSEKTVIAQERAAENKIYCFNIKKNNNKWSWLAEIKSIPDGKCISPKQINIVISSKNSGFGHPLYIQIPRIKHDIPIFIVFRALGIISDKDICEIILLNIGDENKNLLYRLKASIIEANNITDKQSALDYINTYAMYTPINMEKEKGARKKMEFTTNVIENDLYPHCNTKQRKIYFLGFMISELIKTSMGLRPIDDRDSYANKRIDLNGSLLNNLFRNYFNKLVKDMNKQIVREINTGSWKSKENYMNIINHTNIYKIVKSTTIENGIKRALATGDFGIKNTNSNKVGVAQVLNRLTYVSSLSHSRRVNTPIDKSGKLIPPRKLHNTQWGFICPAETPEGPPVGVVKNLSYLAHVTIRYNTSNILDIVTQFVIPIDDLKPNELYKQVKVLINGNWIGITKRPEELFNFMKLKKQQAIINIYTSIIFDVNKLEIKICNEGGRIMRPVLNIEDGKLVLNKDIVNRLRKNEIRWDDLFTDHISDKTPLQYIDADEQNYAMIAMDRNKINENNTHCEIHPSTIFGLLASCIPFPDHNQSPRNTYQCAMGKQAMGTYATNYNNRMDKTAYILSYPMKPLVGTRLMDFVKLNNIPSGNMLVVAIMSYTGYNQEDSILFNKGSIDRGLLSATIFHTEKDEDKKIHGDVEIRCKPDKNKTKGMRFANYNKLNSDGIVPENTLIDDKDIIIGKMIPIKAARNDHTQVIKYSDQSRMYRTVEECYIDKNYIHRNGDGYTFAKTRIRAHRTPTIGDKFCLLPTSYVLTDIGWIQLKDIDIKKHKVATLQNGTDLDYVYPVNKYEFDCVDEELYHMKSQQINMICTKNHRLYIQKRGRKNFEFMEAKDAFGKMVRYKKDAVNIYPDQEHICLDGVEYLMNPWLKLLGIYIADGSRCGNNRQIKLCGLKPRKKEFMANTCKELGIDYSVEDEGVRISGAKYPEILDNLLNKKAHEKYLPDYVWNLSQEQSRILMNSLMLCDGHTYSYKNKSGFSRYGTVSIKLANDIQKLALQCGWSGIIKLAEVPGKTRTGTRNLGKRKGEKVTITQRHNYYKISIIRKQNNPWVNKKKNDSNKEEYIKYTGKVGCIEVPDTHLFYYKEDEFSPPCWSGNSSRHG